MVDFTAERLHRNPFSSDPNSGQTSARTIPIIHAPGIQHSLSPPGDPMEVVSPGAPLMPPPIRSNEEIETNGMYDHMGMGDQQNGPSAAAAGQAGIQQPKVVQTAFIHKLYNMLEDASISSLISWSQSNDSFIMSPSNDFSKVLAQYFKHTNISSFVRQLNMYGFHKVSDVFHGSSPESPLWEFKHGGGSFKRGDLMGLREIKRRASRHTLIHRDSYSAPKPPLSQPGTPAEPMHSMQDSTETRLAQLEQNQYEVHARLQRSEDNSQFLHVRNQVVMNALSQSLQLNSDMARILLSLTPNPEDPRYRELMNLQVEIQRQAELVRNIDEAQPETPFGGNRPYFANLSLENAPVSPRQLPQDDARRGMPMGGGPPRISNNAYQSRAPAQTHLSITPRRYGSIGGTSQSSPSSLRPQVPALPPAPHPLHQSMSSPPMGRRHTSADIRVPGWQGNQQHSPFASGHSSSAYPSSPKRGPMMISEDQHIRDSFSNYSLSNATRSRPTTPPTNGNTMDHFNQFSFGGPRERSAVCPPGMFRDNSGPPTRRGSMAHILNPAETAEREEEHEEEMREEDRNKRKRVQ